MTDDPLVNTDDLPAQLRRLADSTAYLGHPNTLLFRAAADRIEADALTIAGLRDELAAVEELRHWDHCVDENCEDCWGATTDDD